MEKQFFMIYMEGGGAPTFKHGTEVEANNEAKRLTERFGRKTYVLSAIRSFEMKVNELKEEKSDYQDSPF